MFPNKILKAFSNNFHNNLKHRLEHFWGYSHHRFQQKFQNWKCYWIVLGMFGNVFWECTSHCFQNVLQLFENRLHMFWNCLGMFWNCSRKCFKMSLAWLSKLFWVGSELRDCFGMFSNCLGTVPAKFYKCVGDVLKMFWKWFWTCFGNIWGYFWMCLQVFSCVGWWCTLQKSFLGALCAPIPLDFCEIL